MNIDIRYIPPEENEWTVTRAISAIVHSDAFATSEEERKVNFKVSLNANKVSWVGHDGTGTLTVPTNQLGKKFLDHVKENPIKLSKKRLKFYRSFNGPPRHVVATLGKTPFVNPDIEEKHVKTMAALEDSFRMEKLQFGTFFREGYPGGNRSFSVEWEKDYTQQSRADLHFEYDHKLIRIKVLSCYSHLLDPVSDTLVQLGDPQTEDIGYTVAINFASIRKIAVGYDFAKPCKCTLITPIEPNLLMNPDACFDILTPPVMEQLELHRTLTGDKAIDNEKYKWRVGSLNPRHNAVAAYATQVRVVFHSDPQVDKIDEFVEYCMVAGLSESLIARFRSSSIEVKPMAFFNPDRIERLHRKLAGLPFAVAFQMEALLRNGLLHTGLVEELLPHIQKLCEDYPEDKPILKEKQGLFVSELLRKYNQDLQTKITSPEHPLKRFEKVQAAFEYSSGDMASGNFRCGHVTFTPTRVLLEGPYATQSNRIIREYDAFCDHFLRVDFRDEDRLQYRWDRSVDGTQFLKDRVGGILKGGFDLAGRNFEFLAYSTSALREHAVWFISPFKFTLPTGQTVLVDGEYIRHNIGDFHGSDLLRHPSKYAARLAQAFTATNPSVYLSRHEWEEVPDLGKDPYLFTDGVGTISYLQACRIYSAMNPDKVIGSDTLIPSAVSID